MTSFLLAYDLRNESDSHDYQPLWDELERLGAHRTQYSLWLVAADNTAKELHDHFKRFLDDDDRLWINEIVKNKHYSNAMAGTNAWLDANPPRR